MGFEKSKNESIKLPKNVNLFVQTYDKQILPDGVFVIKANVFPDDGGGWFKESLRVDKEGCVESLKQNGLEFRIRQSNMSYLGAFAERFWHIHPKTKTKSGQNEIWLTNSSLVLGLVDLRKESKTYGVKSKIVISPDKAVYIPSGVAHGLYNPNNFPVTLVYFADQQFSIDDTQEYRIDPKELPFDFVEPDVM